MQKLERPNHSADGAAPASGLPARDHLADRPHDWRPHPGGTIPPLDLAVDGRPIGGGAAMRATTELSLPAATVARLARVAEDHGAELPTIVLAALGLLLYRMTGDIQLVIGLTAAHAGAGGVTGRSGSRLLEMRFCRGETFSELLSTAQRAYGFTRDRHDIQPALAVASRRDEESAPTPDIVFEEGAVAERSDASATPLLTCSSATILSVSLLGSADAPRLRLVSAQGILSAERARHVGDQLLGLLEQVASRPDRAIDDYSLLTDSMRRLLPDPRRELDEPTSPTVPELFFAQAALGPDRAAICHGESTWTAGEAAARVRSLATVLHDLGVEPGSVVAVTGPRCAGLYIGMMGVLASRGILLSLDPIYPEARARYMLQASHASLIVIVGENGPGLTWLTESGPCPVLRLDANGDSPTAPSHEDALPRYPDPGTMAYVFFTSGTTGTPKAVLCRHKSLSQFLAWEREQFGVGPADRTGQLTGLSFDVVLRDVFLPLTSGATLCVPDVDGEIGGGWVLPWLAKDQITLMHTVPSVLQAWLNQPRPTGVALEGLRWLLSAGEPLTGTLVDKWRAVFPGEFAVLYGTTETPLAKCFYVVPEPTGSGPQPVGWAIPNHQALVLAASGVLCSIGEPGEICVRTPFLAEGYINRPGQTLDKFVPNPLGEDPTDRVYCTGDRGRYGLDGRLEVIGRVDDQVKVHGVRVEPAEVAAVLARHPGVAACTVLGHKDARGETALVAYWLPTGQEPVPVASLRAALATELPSAMVPSHFVRLDKMPLTPNGKIDRKALPPPPLGSGVAYVAPRNPTEATLADLWSEALRVERVGVDDNFFDLGGHSLLAAQVAAGVARRLHREISMMALFAEQTIAGQARVLLPDPSPSAGSPAARGGGVFRELARGHPDRVRLLLIHPAGGMDWNYADFVRELGHERGIFGANHPDLLRAGAVPTVRTIAETALFYVEELRRAGLVPCVLAGWSYGATVALEMAFHLQDQLAGLVLFEPNLSNGVNRIMERLVLHLARLAITHPKMARLIPGARQVVALKRISQRFLIWLMVHEARCETVADIVAAAEFCFPEEDELRRVLAGLTFDSAWERFFGRFRELGGADEIKRLIFPHLSTRETLDLATITMRNTIMEHRWIPNGGFAGPVLSVACTLNQRAERVLRYCTGPVKIRRFPLVGSDGYRPHFCMFDPDNVRQFVPDVAEFLRDLDTTGSAARDAGGSSRARPEGDR